MKKPEQMSLEFVEFDGEKTKVPLNLDGVHETFWATESDMAELFGTDVQTIAVQVKSIFQEGELDQASVIRKLQKTSKDGRIYKALHYNLDVILSVGYRISSKRATAFRQKATKILKSYLEDGYAINESRLVSDASALSALAANVRRLRSGEKQIYEQVRECFKISASDYDAKSKHTKQFYARLQDKFLYAILGKTASEIILDRADGSLDLMGLTCTRSGTPTLADAKVGKNYLMRDELYLLHILCEQFLLFVESRAVQGRELTMAELAEKFDQLLEVQGHPVFPGYTKYLRKVAEDHARRELKEYQQRLRILSNTTSKRSKLKRSA